MRFRARLTILRTFRLAPPVVRASRRRSAPVRSGRRVSRAPAREPRAPHRGSRIAGRRVFSGHLTSLTVPPAPCRVPGRHPEPARPGLSLFRLCFVP
ncbi:conserved hypothetical protein [Burkholderia ambifaria AMMD]|uniref:Uncharacterized protein n=1 Tax=Burkholderia ambifaria (strain ATCC BAA-244 / DSM 16087 / CCUG 44356 / LMG 19182 / AMMD) TaxID=339670 RepID=Q0BI64_BURCM|nr:conserved hypothetical protein [Burkholderia ambifaria AMMD]